MNKKRVISIIIVTIAIIVAILFAIFVDIGEGFGQATTHCPDHSINFKHEVGKDGANGNLGDITFTIDGDTVTFSQNVEFCIKSSTWDSGKQIGDTGSVSDGKDISYVVIYSVPEETETPIVTETPEETETPVVTETPEITETPEVTETLVVTETVRSLSIATDVPAGGGAPRIVNFLSRMIYFIQSLFGG